MKAYRIAMGLVICALLGGLVFSSFVSQKYYLWMSFLFIGLLMIPFYIRFEAKAFSSKEIVFIAVMAAIAGMSRVPFAAFPSAKPVSFVIIVSAIVLGGEAGFMIGATAALVSNIYFGQGPWTPWQMFCWGMIGFTAGVLRNTFVMKTWTGRLVFGFVWGFLFGWIMNLWFIIGFLKDPTWEVFVSAYIASFYFDLTHALANVTLLALFSTAWIKILNRFKMKYGILEREEKVQETQGKMGIG